MTILCLGLSHHTAPVAVREHLAFTPAALTATLVRLGCGHSAPAGLHELVILSTCNRLELYADSACADPAPLIALLAEVHGRTPADFTPYLYHHTGPDAVRHLCRVAAGLDSLVLGEPQILGQVAHAFSLAHQHGAASRVLTALFQTAIQAGRRARSETAISRNPSNISAEAVRLAEHIVGDLTQAEVLIIGAGEMAELAAATLHTRGARGITVVSRTFAHAAELAARWNGHALTFAQLTPALAAADIVIASSGAPHMLVLPGLARAAMHTRPDRPLLFIDIALPRDVDPEVTSVPNVHCYDLDHLHNELAEHTAERTHEIPQVETIVADESARFLDWLRQQDITPVLADLRTQAETIRRAEVTKTLRRLAHLPQEDQERIEALSLALMNKLLHEPTQQLKACAGQTQAPEYAALVRQLFRLSTQS